MNRWSAIPLLCTLLLLLPALDPPRAQLAAQKKLTATRANGLWEYRGNEFKIWALNSRELQIKFDVSYSYGTPTGPKRSAATRVGTAVISGDSAIFRPDNGVGDNCIFTLRIRKGRLMVEQKGTCGYAGDFNGSGTYRRTSSRRPRMVEN
jgi:hypothetical protein